MSTIGSTALAAASISYNGIQFGGSEAVPNSTPPEYRFRGEFVYDQAGRAVKGTKYTLTVHSIFTALTEVVKAGREQIDAEYIRDKLSEPRRELIIEGLGPAFQHISNDDEWGPKPRGFEWNPLGKTTWSVTWTVEFFIKDCTHAREASAWGKLLAFNFSTSWSNDYEGKCSRTISGYAEIAVEVTENADGSRTTPKHTADKLRDTLKVLVPPGFRRVSNTWVENTSKNRLDFSIVDEGIPGEVPPPGCISAQGSFGWNTHGAGLAQGVATMAMTLRTAPGVAPEMAGLIFGRAVKAKQQEMTGGLSSSQVGAIIPVAMSIHHNKYDESRVTRGMISWKTAGTQAELFNALGIWKPITENNYTTWVASIQTLWHNRGATVNGVGLRSIPSEGVVIDLCDKLEAPVIGGTSIPQKPTNVSQSGMNLPEPEIPQDGGYMGVQISLTLIGGLPSVSHQLAQEYSPGQVQSPRQSNDNTTPTNIPNSKSTTNVHNVTEYLGWPTTEIAVTYRALRAKYLPVPPILRTVQGVSAVLIRSNIGLPQAVFDAVVPVWYMQRTDVYRLEGRPVSKMEATSNPLVRKSGTNKENK